MLEGIEDDSEDDLDHIYPESGREEVSDEQGRWMMSGESN